MNRKELEYLVGNVYPLVKNTIFDSSKHEEAVVNVVFALFNSTNIQYEEEYFKKNLKEIYDYVVKTRIYLEPDFPKQVFIHG